jgi:hypothetical protein
MTAAGNSKMGCPCGQLRSRTDPKLVNVTPPYLQIWPPGVMKKDSKNCGAIVRACVQCGTLYALTHYDDDALPEQAGSWTNG